MKNKDTTEKTGKTCGRDSKTTTLLLSAIFFLNLYVLLKMRKIGGDEHFKKLVDRNPKTILDSVQRFVDQQQAESQRKQQIESDKSVRENLSKIRDEKYTGVYNPKGHKILVIFYDYNCAYCKMASEAVEELVKNDGDIKVIFRELPIFGGISELAAKYSTAVAMVEPNKFFAFHSALMKGDAKSEEGIKEALHSAGLDYKKVHNTLVGKAAAIEKRIRDNMDLAQVVGIQGTPALVAGDEFIPGYIDAVSLGNKFNVKAPAKAK